MWQELVRTYALRARQFSEAVAELGKHRDTGPELLELMKEVNRRRTLCNMAAEELDRYIERTGQSVSIAPQQRGS